MSIKLKSKESVYKHNRVNISSHLLLIIHTHRKFGGHTEKSATARDCATGYVIVMLRSAIQHVL